MAAISMSRRGLTFDRTIEILFLLSLFASACLVPAQSDTWWHLRAGKEMWSRHFVMLADEFSFTAQGSYWPNHEWLGDVALFAAYRLAGLPGMTVLAAACITGATAISWRLMRGRAIVKLLLMAIAMPSLVFVWAVRPLVFTLLLLMVVLQLVLKSIYWPLPIVFALWANLHGGVALGLVVLAGAAGTDVWFSGRSRVLPWAALIGASVAATLVTPLGLHLWTTIPESVHKSVANGILEWRPAVFGWRDAAFWAIAAALLAVTIVRYRAIVTRQHAALTAVALALLPLAVRYGRNITPFLLVAVPALSWGLHATGRGAAREEGPGRKDRYAFNMLLLTATAIISAATVARAWSGPAARLKWQPVSREILAAVESCPGPLYNRFDDGGYLIWFAPDVPVFVDNRQDPYALEFLQEHLRSERSGMFEGVFERYRIQCAFLPPGSPTAQRLLDAGWTVDARDEHWVVFERPVRDRLSRSAPATPTRQSR